MILKNMNLNHAFWIDFEEFLLVTSQNWFLECCVKWNLKIIFEEKDAHFLGECPGGDTAVLRNIRHLVLCESEIVLCFIYVQIGPQDQL